MPLTLGLRPMPVLVISILLLMTVSGCRQQQQQTPQEKIDEVIDTFELLFTGETTDQVEKLFASEVHLELDGERMPFSANEFRAFLADFAAETAAAEAPFQIVGRVFEGDYSATVTANLDVKIPFREDLWPVALVLREDDKQWVIIRIRTTDPT